MLAVLYLIFNEGYLASAGDAAERRDLARDADWLASLLVRLMPDEPEAMGLLALMRLHLARADARFTADGAMVLLPDQDRDRWDRPAIAEAEALVERRCASAGRALSASGGDRGLPRRRPIYPATDWAEVVALYDRLLRHPPTPVVALNRALAVAELRGPRGRLAAVAPLAERLADYHLYHAARGVLLRRLGRLTRRVAPTRRRWP